MLKISHYLVDKLHKLQEKRQLVHSDHLPYCLVAEPWTFPLGFIIDSILQMGN